MGSHRRDFFRIEAHRLVGSPQEVSQGEDPLDLSPSEHLLEDLRRGQGIPEGRMMTLTMDMVAFCQCRQAAIHLHCATGGGTFHRTKGLIEDGCIQNWVLN